MSLRASEGLRFLSVKWGDSALLPTGLLWAVALKWENGHRVLALGCSPSMTPPQLGLCPSSQPPQPSLLRYHPLRLPASLCEQWTLVLYFTLSQALKAPAGLSTPKPFTTYMSLPHRSRTARHLLSSACTGRAPGRRLLHLVSPHPPASLLLISAKHECLPPVQFFSC